MTSLIPCIACERHVRRHEAQCPFCGAAQSPSSGPFREVVMPRDAARATLFALGLSLAAHACGGQSEGDNDPSPSGAGASIGNAGGSGGSTGANGGSSNTNVGGYDGPTVPPYGGIPRPLPETGGSSGSTGLPDASVPRELDDAGSGDSGPGNPDSGDAAN